MDERAIGRNAAIWYTGAPARSAEEGKLFAQLRSWEKRTTCPKAREVVRRIQEWLNAGDPSMMLDLTHCELVDGPPWPDTVRNVNLSWNPSLSELAQPLPPALESLAVMFCDLTALPDEWPPGLQRLLIAGNRIAALPESLPDSVREIGAANNRIEQIPQHLPQALESLGLGTNQILRVPISLLSMPQLKKLALANNPLTPACLQELRQETAKPGYAGPSVTIGFIGDEVDWSEILPAARADHEVRIMRADPLRAQVQAHLAHGAIRVASYSDEHRTVVLPEYRNRSTPAAASSDTVDSNARLNAALRIHDASSKPDKS